MDPRERATRHAERQAATLFLAAAIATAVTVAGMMVAGWSGGALDNRIEPLFWAGAILGGVGVACLGIAAVPGAPGAPRDTARRRLLSVGLALFLAGPVLCVTGVFVDYWI